MVEKDDWRLTNQEKYLKGTTLHLRTYSKYNEDWDHDHCEFCMKKITETGKKAEIHKGYATEDNYRWICIDCFNDFKEMFEWKVKA